MIYLDACTLIKFVKHEAESKALHVWRNRLNDSGGLITSELARLEISRALLRSGVNHERISYAVTAALSRVDLVNVTHSVLARARAYRIKNLASLDAIHLATAEPFRAELSEFVTYDLELAEAATELGLNVNAPA